MTSPQNLIYKGKGILENAHVPDSLWDAGMLLSDLTGKDPLALRLDTEFSISPETEEKFLSLIGRRAKREPLQYILRCTWFMGHRLSLDSRVLIPRQETELLCEKAIGFTKANLCSVLDLCCGSGCIGISLKLECPEVSVDLSDFSPDAIENARENAEALDADVSFFKGDLFHAVPGKKYGLILSNPPYIPTDECGNLQKEVLLEPLMALDGGKDGLDFYRRIADEASEHLTMGGRLMMEVGFGEAEAVKQLLLLHGFSDVNIYEDYQQIPRIVDGKYAGKI